MSQDTTASQTLATRAGIVIVVAAAHLTIVHTGGYGLTTQAPLVMALAFGVIAGARAVGDTNMPRNLGFGIAAALLAGEAYNFVSTLDRMVDAREELQAPIRAKHEKRADAIKAQLALEAAPATSERLKLATKALDDAKAGRETQRVKLAREALDKAKADVDEEAKNIRCLKECWRKQEIADKAEKTLKDALAAAEADRSKDVGAAKTELTAALAEAQAQHTADVDAAKAAVEANPEPRSATPTADRIGIAPWAFDLIIAALLSIGANGLAGMLLAYGAGRETDACRMIRAGQHRPYIPANDLRPAGMTLPDDPDGSPNGGSRVTDRPSATVRPEWTRQSLRTELEAIVQSGRTFPSQREIARIYGIPASTLSDWFKVWGSEGGEITRKPVGRCKMVA